MIATLEQVASPVHDPECRRRRPMTMGSGHRGLDPDGCDRCRFLVNLLDRASVRRKARR